MGEIIPRPTPPVPMPFTGERLTSEYGGQTEIEHLHRYLLAREWCREKDVLDVASGEGYGTAMLAQVAKSAIGVEIADDAVAHATSSYQRANLTYLQGDARSIPVADASRDVVVSFETIEHFAEQQQFLNEVRRVLRPGGLFIVSTPDRDNYSPPDSPVNAYHVKEMTGTEFQALLLASFARVSILLQRPIFGSVLLPAAAETAVPLCFERRGSSHFEASAGLARPQYLVAFASDGPAAVLPSSVYIESGRLGMLNPEESAARLRAAEAAADPEAQARLRHEIDALQQHIATLVPHEAHAKLRQENDALVVRQAALAAELEACQTELAAARGEVRGLRIANEMAEAACATLRAELRPGRPTGAQTQSKAAQPETNALSYERVQQLEADLTTMRLSTSWRVTAPLRQFGNMLKRRP
jgi:SAM-dependent methyltransferase